MPWPARIVSATWTRSRETVMETFLQNGLLVICVEQQKRKGRKCCKLLPDSDILRLCDFVDCCCRFLCCTQVLMCCCTFVCDVFSRVRQVHPRAGDGLPSNTMRHSRVSDSGDQAPVYLNPSFSPSQSINSAGFKILIVSLAKKEIIL